MEFMLEINKSNKNPQATDDVNNFLRCFDGYSAGQKILVFYEDVESLPCLLESSTDPCHE
jgi:hypothetical protein